ncbi:sensor histidine kinase [Halocola ammonii]
MKIIWTILLFLLTTCPGLAQVEFNNEPYEPIGQSVFLLEAGKCIESFQIAKGKLESFKKSDQRVPNLGVTEKISWVRFTISNDLGYESTFLELAKPSIDEVTFYFPDGKGDYDSLKTGYQKPINNRNFRYQSYIFDLDLDPEQSKTFYLKVKSADQIQLPMYLCTERALFQKLLIKDLLFGVFSGIFLVMFFYNFFLYLSTRDRTYLLYVLYLIVVFLTQANLSGQYTYRFFWPNLPKLEFYSTYFLSGFVGITIILFFNSFLQLKQHSPTGYRITVAFIPVYIIAMSAAFLGYFHESYIMLQIIVGTLAVVLLIINWILVSKGVRQARFFMVAWTIFILGAFIYVLKDFNILPYNTLTASGMQIGSAIEVVLLSFALADRINILKKEKEQSQARALLALRENERIIKEQNLILESKVKERTEKLQKSNEELTQTLEELKSTQAQLVDAEKMASLGQLTAGIAHELNNPINFVASNVKPLERDFNDLMQVLDKVDELASQNDGNEAFDEVVKLKKELDTDYLKDEVRQLLSGVAEGAKRTAEIVRGLRIFSRLDEDSLKKANVNECLDSTIIVLKSHVRGRAKVIRQFDDELMPIKCYPGKLNQVFMNIISNAVQATEMSKKPLDERWVKVKSYQDSENIYVSIKDNGCGMDEETQHKIFEPFFTTKEVGEGTGLGLAIVLGIIKDHNGNIEVKSAVNEGTEFLITLSKSL